MANQLTQEDIESIVEGYQDFPTAKVLKKAGNLMVLRQERMILPVKRKNRVVSK